MISKDACEQVIKFKNNTFSMEELEASPTLINVINIYGKYYDEDAGCPITEANQLFGKKYEKKLFKNQKKIIKLFGRKNLKLNFIVFIILIIIMIMLSFTFLAKHIMSIGAILLGLVIFYMFALRPWMSIMGFIPVILIAIFGLGSQIVMFINVNGVDGVIQTYNSIGEYIYNNCSEYIQIAVGVVLLIFAIRCFINIFGIVNHKLHKDKVEAKAEKIIKEMIDYEVRVRKILIYAILQEKKVNNNTRMNQRINELNEVMRSINYPSYYVDEFGFDYKRAIRMWSI